MINPEKLALVKAATLAIGLVDKGGIIPKKVCGTGFIINQNHYVMTAGHVIDDCLKWHKMYKDKSVETEIVAFNSVSTSSELKFHVMPLNLFSDHSFARSNYSKTSLGFAGPENIDICIGKFLDKYNNMPFLEIKKPSKLELYSEVAMCGYPNGDQSLDLEKKFMGIRFSPIMQIGRISGFLPSDDSPIPFAVQTDIVGTGGSSGSPIIDPIDGQVISVAQQVIVAGVQTNNNSIYGSAKIGLTLGVTNHIFYELSQNVSKYLEDGIKLEIDIQSTHFGTSTVSYG